MKKTNCMKWVCGLSVILGVASCNLDMPKETKTSFETMVVKKSDIELPYKFSARMKGQNDVTVTPQVSGQLMKICVADCQAAQEKDGYYKRQVTVLQDAYFGTHELMDNGKANYLEVLTAQESLLNAQLNEAMNLYKGAQALIALYIALGGATK